MSRVFRFDGDEYIPGVPMYGIAPGSLVEVDDDNQIVSITPITIAQEQKAMPIIQKVPTIAEPEEEPTHALDEQESDEKL